MDAIAAYDMTKIYGGKGEPGGVTALQGINLQVPEGRAMACVGHDRSGKTTLIRLLAGLCRPTQGECSVLGLSPSHESARLHSMVGTVLYSAKLYPTMSLWHNLLFFAGVHGVEQNEGIERASFLLRRLNLWEERERRPGELSTGALKRAGLARALIHRPKVLLFDEQGAGMDRETGERVRELLRYTVEQEGTTLLYCTQNMNYIQDICGSFGLLSQGRLIARGDLESLRTGAGVRLKAALRLADGQSGPEGFRLVEGFWQREIPTEAEMPRLIAQAVAEGLSLFEARVQRPTLEEIYQAYLSGGRRREEIVHGETNGGEPAQSAQPQPAPQPAAGPDGAGE